MRQFIFHITDFGQSGDRALWCLIIMFTGWNWIDPVVAIGIGLWVLPRTWILLKDTTHVLLEGVPRGISLGEVRAAIADIAGVAGVHDLHVWSVSSDDASASVHVELAGGSDPDTVRKNVADLLVTRYGLAHATIQTERGYL